MVDKIQSDFYKSWKGNLIDLAIAADTTLDKISEYISVDTSGGAVEVEFPEVDGSFEDGKKIWIIDAGSAATNNITVIPNALDTTTIDGGTDSIIDMNDAVVIFELVENVWTILNSASPMFDPKVKTITNADSPFTITDQDIILADPSAGDITVILPLASARFNTAAQTSTPIIILNIHDMNNFTVNVDGNGSETINEVASIPLKRKEGIKAGSDNTEWWILLS